VPQSLGWSYLLSISASNQGTELLCDSDLLVDQSTTGQKLKVIKREL